MPDDDIMFSRSGRSDPAGKLTERIDIPVTEELNNAIVAMATLAGKGKAEFARRLLEKAIFGELDMLRRLSGHGGSPQSDQYPTNGGAL